jgi:hypothetical protein
MKTLLHQLRRQAVAVVALGLALSAPAAWASGTASGTDISNNATVNFQVGGVNQTSQSNTVTFKVDNLVRVVVAESGSTATSVIPGASAQVTTFTVTNTGNTTQDYSLATANLSNGITITLGSNYTDSFDGNSCQVHVEGGGGAGYQSGSDTAAAIQNLAADASVTVYVVCDIPLSLSNSAAAIVSLTATTANAGTCAANGTGCVTTTQTAGADTQNAVDVVFGDTAGSDDSNRDGKHSARDAYAVTTATLSISKTVTPICDPFNFNGTGGGTQPPKNVPGAYVQYAITIANANGAGQSATLTTITDVLPAAIAYDPDLRTGSASACATSNPENSAGKGFKLTCTGGARACASTAVYYTGASDSDAVTVSGQNVTVTAGDGPGGVKALPTETGYAAGELKPNESITIRFNAIIQ